MRLLISEESGYVHYPEYKPEYLADHGIFDWMIRAWQLAVFPDPNNDQGLIVINRMAPGIIEIIKIRLRAGEWV